MKNQEVVLVMGYQACGKTTYVDPFIKNGYVRLNRDTLGGRIVDMVPLLEKAIGQGKNVVLDNTFLTADKRLPFIEVCRKAKVKCRCILIDAKIEDSQYNACHRMMERYGSIFEPGDFEDHKDPNIFPPHVLFAARKMFEPPVKSEGFDVVEVIPFKRKPQGPEYKNKAIIFDYDGTLRDTISGAKFPVDPKDIKILPGRIEKLKQLKKDGYQFFGVSNQSGVSKGDFTYAEAEACFKRTNDLLGFDIEVKFCPHPPAPIQCYCRKPMCGFGVYFIDKYLLNKAETIFVGDQTTDKTFAGRCGIKYIDQKDFF